MNTHDIIAEQGVYYSISHVHIHIHIHYPAFPFPFPFHLGITNLLPTISSYLRRLRRQLGHLVQKRLTLPSRILQHLIPQMIHLLARSLGRIPLRSLDPGYLHREKELGYFDALNRARDAAQPSLGRSVHVQRVLEGCEIGFGEGRCGFELRECEF